MNTVEDETESEIVDAEEQAIPPHELYERYEINGPGDYESAAEEQTLPPHDIHEV